MRYPPAVMQLTFQRARTEQKKRQRAAAIVEAALSLAQETGVAPVTLAARTRSPLYISAPDRKAR